MTEARRGDAIAIALLALLPTLLFADVLLGINDLYLRDIAQYFHPMKLMLRDALLSGEFPYWNHRIYAGQPMAANPAHQLFYPPGLLILLPSYRLGASLLLVLHIHLSLRAMYALLRAMRIRPTASFAGAVSFGLGGFTLSGLTFTPSLLALSWLPLVALYGGRFILRGARRDLAIGAAFFALQITTGAPSVLISTALLLASWALYVAIKRRRVMAPRRPLTACVILVGMAALTAAVQLLPGVDHFAGTARLRGFDARMAGAFSMPPLRLAESFFPNVLGHSQANGRIVYWASRFYPGTAAPYLLSIYSGLLVAVLTTAGLARRTRGSNFVAAILLLSVVLAIGTHSPFFGIMQSISASLRFPEKYIVLGGFVSIVFASLVLDRILGGDQKLRRTAAQISGAVALVGFAAWAATFAPAWPAAFVRFWHPRPENAIPEMLALWQHDWLMAGLRGLLLVVLLRMLGTATNDDGGRRSTSIAALICAFVILDLAPLIPELAPRVSPDFYSPPAVLRRFPEPRSSFRLFNEAASDRRNPYTRFYLEPRAELYWILRNGLTPLTGAAFGMRSALDNDFDQTVLAPTTDFTRSMWELSTLRPDWATIAASMSNVWFRAVWRDPRQAIAASGDDLRDLIPVTFVENEHFPRYYFARELVSVSGREDFVRNLAAGPFRPRTAFVDGPSFRPASGMVHSWRESTNGVAIDAEASGGAFLVMSVTPHKYWTVTVDEKPVRSIVTNVGYQGIRLEQGRHRVQMRYRNPLVAAGAAISLTSFLALAWMARTGPRRRGDRIRAV